MKDSSLPQSSKNTLPAEHRAMGWKRLTALLLGAAGALVLLGTAVALTLYFAFRTPQPASESETTVLKRLEREYDAKHKLDDKSRVTRLELEGPHVSDEAIDDVVKLKYLKELSLAKSSVSDEGIKKLTELKRLEHLGLTDTRVSDEGLKYLEKIPALRNLWVVENERLTKHGIGALKRALPGISIHVMNQPSP